MFSRGGIIETEGFQGGESRLGGMDDFWLISAVGAIIGLIIFLVDSKIPPLF